MKKFILARVLFYSFLLIFGLAFGLLYGYRVLPLWAAGIILVVGVFVTEMPILLTYRCPHCKKRINLFFRQPYEYCPYCGKWLKNVL